MAFDDSAREQYKHLEQVARRRGISEEKLVQGFELEREFHLRIVGEKDPTVREHLYYEQYERIYPLYKITGSSETGIDIQSKAELVNLFRNELRGKSILDVGCGNGQFLNSVDANLEHGKLVGIDISPLILPEKRNNVTFMQGNVINFSLDDKFDVVFSDNVIEHIALPDLPVHLQSVKNALVQGGTLIIISPNRLFGPHDGTKIIDATYTNQIEAVGSHLHETTYTELISILKEHGFSSFKTIIPLAGFSPSFKTIIPLAGVSHYFPNTRISLRFVQAIENHKYLLNAIYKFKILSMLLSWLQIVLLCTYSN
jgi:SAM-dependent methyltransferase